MNCSKAVDIASLSRQVSPTSAKLEDDGCYDIFRMSSLLGEYSIDIIALVDYRDP